MASDPWVKVWWDWYASRSHRMLGFDALHLGAWLMNLAKASPDPPWILNPDGSPPTVLELARGARMMGSDEEVTARMLSALRELVRARTLVARNGDEAFGFTKPGWAKFQQSPAYFRVRDYRERERNASGNADETGRSRSRDQKEEGRDARGRARGRPSPSDKTAGNEDAALRWLEKHGGSK